MPAEKPPPHQALSAASWIVATILAIVIIIFVGRNLWHAAAEKNNDPVQVDPTDKPHSPHDLTVEPQPKK